ncbi:hypothetical protein CGMCC3_g1441 [Colletotrichum fructicola]|nr:uncharacterized protein CGMCC3_g1441 [Colletotrichum fructicola]KAE9582445.1 hypothetical protein CGMCC3_g1441 [Colletotrichum fructicola]
MGRRMNNGPADERRERTRACACLSSSICRRVAQQDTGSKAESRFHRLRRFCTIEARFWLLAFAVSPNGDGSSSRRFEQTAVPLFHGGISVRFRGWLAARSRAIGYGRVYDRGRCCK